MLLSEFTEAAIRAHKADRVQVFFDAKPDKATRDNLCRGFNWSPTNGAWQRKITGNALYDARQRFKPVAATV